MEKDVLATAKFTAKSGAEKYDITLQLVPSGCTDYGNKHALVYFVDGKFSQCFDARYDKRFNTVESFQRYAYEFVRDQIREDLTVEKA